MSLEAIIGEAITISVEFLDMDEIPVDPSGSPTYKIIDHLGNFVVEGHGIQDQGAPEYWYAMVTIPNGSPQTENPDEHYKVVWRLVSRGGIPYQSTERFKVYATQDEGLSPIEAVFALEGDPIVEDMVITQAPLLNYSINLVDPLAPVQEFETITRDNPEDFLFKNDRSNFFYKDSLDISNIFVPNRSVVERQISWVLKTNNGVMEREIHPCYVASHFIMKMVSDVRQRIDKGQQWHLNQSLNISDWEIIFCVMQAVDRMNMSGPQVTSWTAGTVPDQLRYFLTGYTCVELLDQLYLAYGLSAFDFQGQSTQLSMDPTQYIETMRSNMTQSLDEKFQRSKQLVIRQTRRMGHLSINVGPSTNYPILVDPASHVRFRLRAYLFTRL